MFKTCSYYVQQLYSVYKGSNVLSCTMNKKPIAGQEGQDGLFASSVFDAPTGEVIVKVVNTSKQAQTITLNLQGMTGERTAKTLTLSHSGSPDDENTLDAPEKITPKSGTVACQSGKKAVVITDELPALSFRLYRVKK